MAGKVVKIDKRNKESEQPKFDGAPRATIERLIISDGNRWTTRTSESTPRDGTRSRGGLLIRWRAERRKFGGKKWTQAAKDKTGGGQLGKPSTCSVPK